MLHKEKLLRYRKNFYSGHIKTNQNRRDIWGLEKQQKGIDQNTFIHDNYKYIHLSISSVCLFIIRVKNVTKSL